MYLTWSARIWPGLLCGIVLALQAIYGTAADRPAKSEAGDQWIQNREVRVELQRAYEPRLNWSLSILRWQAGSNQWAQQFQGALCGNFGGAKAEENRQRYRCYYPFQRVSEANQPDNVITNIRTRMEGDWPVLSFRVDREDLWIDARIVILKDTALVLFDCAGTSRDDLRPHWTFSFVAAEQPLLDLVTDDPAKPGEILILEAKKQESKHVFGSSFKYCAVFRPGYDRFYVIVWPELKKEKPRSVQIPKMSGLGSFYLDSPFVLYAADLPCDKDGPTMAHVAEGLHSQVRKVME